MGRRRIILFEIDESMRGNNGHRGKNAMEVENLYVEKGMFLRIEEGTEILISGEALDRTGLTEKQIIRVRGAKERVASDST